MLKLLLHACCGPCSIMPLERLSAEGAVVSAWFFNPNIHPYREWDARRGALVELCQTKGVELAGVEGYGLTRFLAETAGLDKDDRCARCYRLRLEAAARKARETGADAFSTTLLYSRRQKHDLIREVAHDASRKAGGVPFLYRDWRTDWQQGIDASRALGMYRQSYCGCIFSEEERYRPREGGREASGGGPRGRAPGG